MKHTTKVRITKIQFEILEHRLDIPETMFMVFDETEPEFLPFIGSTPFTEEDVKASSEKLAGMAKAGRIDAADLTPLDMEVLVDAVDGSTWLGCAESEWDYQHITHQRWYGYVRSFENLEHKVMTLKRVFKELKTGETR